MNQFDTFDINQCFDFGDTTGEMSPGLLEWSTMQYDMPTAAELASMFQESE
jgi:hypothetical protein